MRAVDIKTHSGLQGKKSILIEHVPTGIMVGSASKDTHEENRKVAMRKLRDTVANHTAEGVRYV